MSMMSVHPHVTFEGFLAGEREAEVNHELIGGLVYANAQKPAKEQSQKADAQGYICPATGEELPCQSCCPLGSK